MEALHERSHVEELHANCSISETRETFFVQEIGNSGVLCNTKKLWALSNSAPTPTHPHSSLPTPTHPPKIFSHPPPPPKIMPHPPPLTQNNVPYTPSHPHPPKIMPHTPKITHTHSK